MKILASSEKLCKLVFPESHCADIPIPPEFALFRWDDLNGVEPRCFELKNSGLELVYDFKECGIIEEFSGSSQFDRLRGWNGPAVFALAIDGKGFHGQHERVWRTGAGNLYLSMAIPIELPVSCAQAVQLLPALIIKAEINNLCENCDLAEVKLPNDVIIRPDSGPNAGIPHKIAGTLTELRVSGDRITQVRYGIGMNLVHAPTQTDPGHLPAIALNDFEPSADPNNPFHYLSYFVYAILGEICTRLNDFDFMTSEIQRFIPVSL